MTQQTPIRQPLLSLFFAVLAGAFADSFHGIGVAMLIWASAMLLLLSIMWKEDRK